MITTTELRKTIETLQTIINSTVHPEIALRAIKVDLKPIRKEIDRLNEIIRRENQELEINSVDKP